MDRRDVYARINYTADHFHCDLHRSIRIYPSYYCRACGCRCAYFDWHCHVRRWHGAHRLRHTRCFGRYDDLCGGR